MLRIYILECFCIDTAAICFYGINRGERLNFTPNDIQNILFKRLLFGFNQLQVGGCADKIVEDMSAYIKENNKPKEKLDDTRTSSITIKELSSPSKQPDHRPANQ